jgi:hypothetical protein
MKHILAMATPLKIRGTVVVLIAINVIYATIAEFIWAKLFCYDSMD